MYPRLTEEQQEIVKLARDFADGELRPHAARWDEAARLDRELFAKLGELGFLGMLSPVRHGGLALELDTFVPILEELARGDASVALAVARQGVVATWIEDRGSVDQREEWLSRLSEGELLATAGLGSLEEAEAGTLGVTARHDDPGWTLAGTVGQVALAEDATLAIVLASGPGGTTGAFLLENPGEHVTASPPPGSMGLRAAAWRSLDIADVKIGEDRVLGALSRDLNEHATPLATGMLGVGAVAVGVGAAALELAAAYTLGREQFGKAIAHFGAIRQKLGRMSLRVATARTLVHAAAAHRGPDLLAYAAMARLVASESAAWVTDEAVQIFGGYGYMREYPVERLMRDAMGTLVLDGTNDFLRELLAREALKAAG